LSSQNIGVLLTDWMMPGVDGPQLCRQVREREDRYVYIVLITGLGNPEQVLEGMSAGADDYLIKPVDPFTVHTRLVAAERVTSLHRQVADFRTQLEQANLELLGQSRTDPLTGLGNRRRMEEDLASVHARALRTQRSYGVAFFDIDHFKLYNDHYGHLAGDEALRQVSARLECAVRSGESVYRYGGEEFLLLMPDATPTDATAAAERIRQSVADANLPHNARPTAPPTVTLSGGVTCWIPGSEQSTVEILHQADQALFRAKITGRNKVQIDRPVAPQKEPAAAVT
jgi:diguanylate cyclase (GGDEF)-like protein